jgi:hypothetical protein
LLLLLLLLLLQRDDFEPQRHFAFEGVPYDSVHVDVQRRLQRRARAAA